MQRHTHLTTFCLLHAQTRCLPSQVGKLACNSKVALHLPSLQQNSYKVMYLTKIAFLLRLLTIMGSVNPNIHLA